MKHRSRLSRLATRLAERFHRRRHTALLTATVAALAVRPLIGDHGAAPALFSAALLILLVVALYNTRVEDLVGEQGRLVVQWRRRRIIALAFAIPALVTRLASHITPSPRLSEISLPCWLAFLAFITVSQLRGLVRHREIDNEAISLSVSIYLLLGLTWAIGYVMLFRHDPGSFGFGSDAENAAMRVAPLDAILPVFTYFSLVTLATIGYGHVYPISEQARFAAVAEGITGQFYLAILVARLVAMQMSNILSRRADESTRASRREGSNEQNP